MLSLDRLARIALVMCSYLTSRSHKKSPGCEPGLVIYIRCGTRSGGALR
jgi:hypothetical protein